MDLSAVIEALLIASEEPLTSSELARLVRARLAEIEDGGGEEEGDYGKAGELGDDLKKLGFFQVCLASWVTVAFLPAWFDEKSYSYPMSLQLPSKLIGACAT